MKNFITKHKFNAIRVEYDGQKFSSKLEGDYFLYLTKLKSTGQVIQFLRQVPFHLPGGVRYVVDFMELWADGNLIFTDTKGMETADFKMKKKLVEDIYRPIKINVVRRGDF